MTSVTLKKLTSLSRDLNQASDLLTQQTLKVEAALNELKLGIWAWVELSRSEVEISGHPLERVESVGYGKYQGKWGLLYSTDIPDLGDPRFETLVPLRDAPRLERIAAVDRLPKLVEALEAKANEVTKLAQVKAAEVSDFADRLRESK